MPGKPRQQTPNTRFGPCPVLTTAGFAHPSRARGRRRAGAPSRSPEDGKPLAKRSLAQAQRDVNSGPAAATPPPPGPEARGHPTPTVSTRRPCPAPTHDGGSRSNKGVRGAKESFIAPGPASQEDFRGEAGEALRLPRGDVAQSTDPGPSPQPATPSRGMDTHRARRGDKRRRTATE